MNTLANEFIHQSILRLKQNTPKIKKCLDELSEDEVWLKPNDSTNSIGNLILHLCGNITQYIISSIGEQPDQRQRDLEFSTQRSLKKEELIEKLSATIDESVILLQTLSDAALLKNRSVQGFSSSSLGNIIQVVEHYSYHTGQIVLWTKLVKNKDLGFYAHLDLNQKNKN